MNEIKENNTNEIDFNSLKNYARGTADFIFDTVEFLVYAIIVSVFALCYVYNIIRVNGTSMLNTLHDGDIAIVNKFFYRPKDGDVVVIKKGQHLDEPLIKRIIATEGQTLQINFSDGTVTVDGKVLDETYIRDPMWLRGDNTIPSVIPEGYTFVMGDNRNHSSDSRFRNVGLIDNNDIVGKAFLIVNPLDRFGWIK